MDSIPNGGGSITLLLRRLSSNPAGRYEDSDCCEAISKFESSEFEVGGSLAANAGPLDKARYSPMTTAPNRRRDAPRAESIGANLSTNMNPLAAMSDAMPMMSGYNRYLDRNFIMVEIIYRCKFVSDPVSAFIVNENKDDGINAFDVILLRSLVQNVLKSVVRFLHTQLKQSCIDLRFDDGCSERFLSARD